MTDTGNATQHKTAILFNMKMHTQPNNGVSSKYPIYVITIRTFK